MHIITTQPTYINTATKNALIQASSSRKLKFRSLALGRWERKFHGMKVAKSESSRDRKLQGAKGTFTLRSEKAKYRICYESENVTYFTGSTDTTVFLFFF